MELTREESDFAEFMRDDVEKSTAVESSCEVRARVVLSRQRQLARQSCVNAQLDSRKLLKCGRFTRSALSRFDCSIHDLKMTRRSEARLLSVACTIADLAEREEVVSDDVMEALIYRQKY